MTIDEIIKMIGTDLKETGSKNSKAERPTQGDIEEIEELLRGNSSDDIENGIFLLDRMIGRNTIFYRSHLRSKCPRISVSFEVAPDGITKDKDLRKKWMDLWKSMGCKGNVHCTFDGDEAVDSKEIKIGRSREDLFGDKKEVDIGALKKLIDKTLVISIVKSRDYNKLHTISVTKDSIRPNVIKRIVEYPSQYTRWKNILKENGEGGKAVFRVDDYGALIGFV